MITQVLELALSLNGGEESVLLPSLVEVAVEELEGRLKGGVSPEQCKTAFVLAAALIALDGLEAATGGSVATSGEISSFSIGDFSVSQSGSGTTVSGNKSYRSGAEALMKPYLNLADFAFYSVKG